MENKNQIVKTKLINLFTQFYLGKSVTIITICWILASFHFTMIYNYQDCINSYDDKNSFFIIFWLSLITIFIVYVPIILYFFINKNKIGKEKDNRIEQRNGNFGFGNNQPQVFILPMYLLWIFSLSKLTVIMYQFYINGNSEDIIVKIVILLVVFIGSFWAWINFKKTSPKSWDFWITVFAISYVLINIYWVCFLPYLKSYFLTINCIFSTIITI